MINGDLLGLGAPSHCETAAMFCWR